MKSVSQLAEVLQTVLTTRAKDIERETGFVQRSTAQLDGPSFAQTTVLCWMDEPEASYSQLQHVAASLGVRVSNQAVEQRFGSASAAFMQRLLEEAVGQMISREAHVPELLRRFNGVYLQDGTLISLPPELAEAWPGWGGNTPEAGQSSLRVQVRLELGQGELQGPWLQAGREAERSGPAVEKPLPVGCLYNVDSGYFTLTEMRRHDQEGHFWLTQAKANVKVYDQRGQCWDLLDLLEAQGTDRIDLQVQAGVKERVPMRLLAVRLSPEQVKERRKRANTQWCGRAQRVPTAGQRPSHLPGQAAAVAQESAHQSRTPAACGVDRALEECLCPAVECGRSAGAGPLSLADRTALETVERAGQVGYVAEHEALPGADRSVGQAAGVAHHPLVNRARLLAGSQPQSGQSQASRRVDGPRTGFGLGRRRGDGARARSHHQHYAARLYAQFASQTAQYLSIGRPP
jgi:hypothetical protein